MNILFFSRQTDTSVTISDIAHTAITQYGPIRMPKNIGPRNHLERLNEQTKLGYNLVRF